MDELLYTLENWYLEARRWFRNSRALDRGAVYLWLDDDLRHREAPRGWYHATSVEEAWDVLTSITVLRASFDHDLGPGGEGYDLVKRLARYREDLGLNFWPEERPTVHSANPVGRRNIEATIDRYGPYKRVR